MKRILILEDDDSTRVQLEHFLRGEPFDFSFAATAAQAACLYLQAWEDGRPFDAGIVDVSMRDKDGFKFVEVVRVWEDADDTPMRFRVLTAYGDLIDKSDLLVRLKIEGRWRKPEDALELRTLIPAWLNGTL